MSKGVARDASDDRSHDTGRQQRLPAARRRDQLIEVAIQLFGRRGYHGTSMDEIADAAGVTKPVLYQHFRSKRQLYLELIESLGTGLTSAVVAAAAAETPRQQVLAGFRAYFQFVAERPNAFRLLFGSGARRLDEFAEAVSAVEDRLADTIAGFISAGLDAEHRSVLGYAIVGLAEVSGRKWVSQFESGFASPPPPRGLASPAGGAGAKPRSLEGGGLDPAEGQRLAEWLADLVWAGLRGLPPPASR